MSKPVLSVLMPTYNAAMYVAQAVASVRETVQRSDFGIELLVLDACSTDATVSLAASAGPWVRVSVQKDRGMYDALNRGLRLAQGHVIAWLNGDDVVDPDGLRTLCEALLREPTANFAFGDFDNISSRGALLSHQKQSSDALGRFRDGKSEDAWAQPLSILWNKAFLSKMNGWGDTYKYAGDMDLWVKAALHLPFCHSIYLPETIGRFRCHEGSITTGSSLELEVYRERVALADTWLQQPNLPPGVHRALTRWYLGNLETYVWVALKKQQPEKAWKMLQKYARGVPYVSLVTHAMLKGLTQRFQRRVESDFQLAS